MSIPATNGRKHGVAAGDFALVQLTEVHGFIMGSECPFVTVAFLAEVTGDGQAGRCGWEIRVWGLHRTTVLVKLFVGRQADTFTAFVAVL